MKKIIDDRGRLFGLISFIDVIVAIVVIVLAIAVFVKFNVGENPFSATNTVDVTFTVKIYRIRESNASHLRPGDKLYITDIGAYLGTIREVRIEEAVFPESLIDGTIVVGNIAERYDVTLTIDAECSYSNNRYYVDRTYELNTNAELWMCSKYNDTRGTIMSIQRSD